MILQDIYRIKDRKCTEKFKIMFKILTKKMLRKLVDFKDRITLILRRLFILMENHNINNKIVILKIISLWKLYTIKLHQFRINMAQIQKI